MTRLSLLIVVCAALACSGAQDAESGAGGTATGEPLTSHSSLAALLPQIDGWTRGEVESASVDLPAPASHAVTSYTRDEARVDLGITDTGGRMEYLEATMKIAGTSFERTSPNGYFRGATVSGAPAVESWNHVDRLAELTVVVAERFVIHSTGAGLSGIEDLRAMVEQVAFDRLASLASR